jgi:hypothetical protein
MINRRKASIYAKPGKQQAAAPWKKAAIKAYWAGESTLGALVDRVADGATRRTPKERPPRRQRSLRRDSSVGHAEREIERVFGLPPGCVRLVRSPKS